MIRKMTLLLGIISLLTGCSNFSTSESSAVMHSESHQLDMSIQQNKEIILKATSHESDHSSATTAAQEKDQLLTEGIDLDLTGEEEQSIRILVSACIHASTGGMEENLLDRKMLESNNKEDELWMQTNFIISLYNNDYAEAVSKILEPVVNEVNEAEMILTWEQICILLEMAGARPSTELQSYDYMEMWREEDYYKFPKFYGAGEIFKELDFEKVEKTEDGSIRVEGIIRLEYDYGAVQHFKVTLVPNSESIFQYSVASIRAEITQPAGTGTIGTDLVIQTPYQAPGSLTNNPYDYIFELDGALYQMPFPARELERNGWKMEAQGTLGAGDRKTVHVSKSGVSLTLGLWNYDIANSNFNDCQVVWIKTGRDKAMDSVNFSLAEGIKNGQTRTEIEPLYHDYYNENSTTYNRQDALYNNMYGYDLYFEHDIIKGFEMGYAPIPWNRQERIIIMTGSWEQDPQTEPSPGEDFEMEMNHVYLIDIDGDGNQDKIRVKTLSGIKWAGFSALFINDEMNYVLRGLASDQISVESMRIVSENGQYYFVFTGGDYANSFYRKVRLEKGWSNEVAFETEVQPGD